MDAIVSVRRASRVLVSPVVLDLERCLRRLSFKSISRDFDRLDVLDCRVSTYSIFLLVGFSDRDRRLGGSAAFLLESDISEHIDIFLRDA